MAFSIANYFGILSAIISFVCIMLAAFLLLVPTERRSPNIFLAIFLILTAIEISGWLWVNVDNQAGWLNALRGLLGKLQMPVFAGFFVASCYSDFRLTRWDYLHLIPLIVAMFLMLPGNQLPYGSGDAASVFYSQDEIALMGVGSHLIYYGYMAFIVWTLFQFSRRYRDQFSNGKSATLIWLTQMAIVSLFAHTLVLVRDLVRFVSSDVYLALQIVGLFIVLLIISWISLKSMLQPELFRRVDRQLISLTDAQSASTSSNLKTLQTYMETQMPYLDADLSLASLSDQVAMTPREVSELLNQSLGVHFFDFVNQYRVRHAQQQLTDHPEKGVLFVLHESGFNSKSSFNTAFKKHVGMTPSAYRQSKLAV